MKFLTSDEFFGPSVNTVKIRMSLEAEKVRKQECLEFLRKLSDDIG